MAIIQMAVGDGVADIFGRLEFNMNDVVELMINVALL
jgi:hypothetical protein